MTLAEVRRFALGMPEAVEAPHFHFSSFRVRGKIFATVPPEHTHVHIFVGDEHREPALAMHPEFLEKLLWGGKVVGLRVSIAQARPDVVEDLLRAAWATKAPKALQSNR